MGDRHQHNLERLKKSDNLMDGYFCIYPYPFHPILGYYDYIYNHDDLAGFSKRAIEEYNQEMDKRYHFVELVKGYLYSSDEFESIVAYFNACQPGDMDVTFVATTDCPLGTLSVPHDLEIIHVFPNSKSGSDTSQSAGVPARHQKILLKILNMDLLILQNWVKFIIAALNSDIEVINRERAELYSELKDKDFTPLPEKTTVEELIAGATDAVKTEKSGGAEAAQNGDYDYLLQMPIVNFNPDMVQKLLEEKSQLDREVEEMRKETPMSLWQKYLDALERKLDAQDKRDADDEEAQLSSYKDRMNRGGPVPSRKAPKNPQKSTKNARKAPKNPGKSTKNAKNTETVAKPMYTASASAMETVEVPQKQATKKPPSRKNVEVMKGNKGERMAAARKAKAAKPPAAPAVTKKRGPAASRQSLVEWLDHRGRDTNLCSARIKRMLVWP